MVNSQMYLLNEAVSLLHMANFPASTKESVMLPKTIIIAGWDRPTSVAVIIARIINNVSHPVAYRNQIYFFNSIPTRVRNLSDPDGWMAPIHPQNPNCPIRHPLVKNVLKNSRFLKNGLGCPLRMQGVITKMGQFRHNVKSPTLKP